MTLSTLIPTATVPYNPCDSYRTNCRAVPGLSIEALTLPDEDVAHWRALLDGWLAEYPPRSLGEKALVEQVAVAAIDQQRARRAKTSLLTEQVRTAELHYDWGQEDTVATLRALLPVQPA